MRRSALLLALLVGGVAAAPAEAQRRAQSDTSLVRVIVPERGGVLYYRAGPGRGVVFRRDLPPDSAAEAAQELVVAEAILEAVEEAKQTLATDTATVARLERVAQAARRSRDRAERREREIRTSQPGPAATERPGRALAPSPVPVTRNPSSPDPTPRDPTLVLAPRVPPSDRDPLLDPLPPVTVEEVERAFVDTGVFRTSRVPFEFGEATLLPEAERVLDAVGEALRRTPSLRITVDGHTDAISSEAFNLDLSQRRAASVVRYLTGRFGIAAERLVSRGFGEASPIATNETETGRALNRRVEFVVLGGAGRAP